jgi:hypothetical protein
MAEKNMMGSRYGIDELRNEYEDFKRKSIEK